MVKLNPDERLLIESGTNHYKVVGPGQIWLAPWQRVLTTLYIGPKDQTFQFNEVYTAEEVPVNVIVQMLYRVDPDLFSVVLFPRIPALNEGGWQNILRQQSEYVLRRLLVGYPRCDLRQQAIQQRLERQLTQTLADHLERIALDIISVCLVKIELPADLQETIIQAEQDGIETRGRATVLREYSDIFGQDLSQAMPYIIQWELLNLLHKNGNPQLLLTSSGLSLGTHLTDTTLTHPIFETKMPLFQAG
jgi:hypothetical protein